KALVRTIKLDKLPPPPPKKKVFPPCFLPITNQKPPAPSLPPQQKKKHPRRTSAYNNGIKPFHVALLLEKTGVNCKDSSVVAPASILLKGSICLNYIR
ncbi:hypothetical protein, partial [Escherichia coli]|uniref:hypothetical protein n=1 Tax=Escherichia coli TaxID=562 RepID=UPI001BC8C7DE